VLSSKHNRTVSCRLAARVPTRITCFWTLNSGVVVSCSCDVPAPSPPTRPRPDTPLPQYQNTPRPTSSQPFILLEHLHQAWFAPPQWLRRSSCRSFCLGLTLYLQHHPRCSTRWNRCCAPYANQDDSAPSKSLDLLVGVRAAMRTLKRRKPGLLQRSSAVSVRIQPQPGCIGGVRCVGEQVPV
jgi:hypothetical protein